VLLPGGVAVLNAESRVRPAEGAAEKAAIRSFLWQGGTELRIDRRTPTAAGKHVTLAIFEREPISSFRSPQILS